MTETHDSGYGLFYSPQQYGQERDGTRNLYQNIVDQVQLAESRGWRNVWLAEHHGVHFGGIINSPEVLGAYLAAKTASIRIGPAISVVPFHNPLILAERYAMLDQLSSGRLDMGIGRGFLAREFEAMNIPMDESAARYSEGLHIIESCWKNSKINYSGDFHTYKNIKLYPSTLQRPTPPIWVAASKSQSSFELAGNGGHNLMVNPYTRTRDEVIEGLGWYREALIKNGYDPKQKRIAAIQHLYIGEINDTLVEAFNLYVDSLASSAQNSVSIGTDWKKHFESIKFDNVFPEKVLFGSVNEVSEAILKWKAIGITDFCFIVQFGNLPWSIGRKTINQLPTNLFQTQKSNP